MSVIRTCALAPKRCPHKVSGCGLASRSSVEKGLYQPVVKRTHRYLHEAWLQMYLEEHGLLGKRGQPWSPQRVCPPQALLRQFLASWACAGPAGGALAPVAPERLGRAHAIIPGSLLADFCFPGRTQGLQAALGRPVAPESRGGRLLQALGWEAGAGLGRSAQGRTEPVPLHLGQGRRGLGS